MDLDDVRAIDRATVLDGDEHSAVGVGPAGLEVGVDEACVAESVPECVLDVRLGVGEIAVCAPNTILEIKVKDGGVAVLLVPAPSHNYGYQLSKT
eukprot:COSAG01_NODE_227_length_21107_cov_85.615099_3_plen_95_part_00